MVSRIQDASQTLEEHPAVDNGKQIVFDKGGQFHKSTMFNPFKLTYGNSTYVLDNIIFYDVDGETRFTTSGWFTRRHSSGNPYTSMALTDGTALVKIKRKKGPDFSSPDPHFMSKGRDYSRYLRADLYIPMDYLDAMGWRLVEVISTHNYQTTVRKSVLAGSRVIGKELFELHHSSETVQHFEELKHDFLKLLEEAEDAEAVKEVLSKFKYKF